jgi:hypothetical protein
MKRQASVGMFCLSTMIIIITLLVLVLSSCGSAKNCHCKCDAYGQVNSVHAQQKTTK